MEVVQDKRGLFHTLLRVSKLLVSMEVVKLDEDIKKMKEMFQNY